MPTFSVIAFDRCLEPTSNDNNGISKSNVNGPSSVKPPGKEYKDSPSENKKTTRGFISPALYATPAAAPIPSDTVESFNPSPYVVDLKRRGPPIMRDGKGVDRGEKVQQNERKRENDVESGGKPCVGSVMASASLGETSAGLDFAESSAALKSPAGSAGLEFVEKIWPGGKSSASVRSSAGPEFVKKISTGGRSPASVTCSSLSKSALARESSIGRQGDGAIGSPNSVLREEDDGCSDDFLETEEWKSIASSSDMEDISATHQKSLNYNSQSNQSEFFDALEDISLEDVASQGSEPKNTRLQTELDALKENLLVETRKRKQIEETLNHMQNQWQKMANIFSSAGISFPSTIINSVPRDMGLDCIDEIGIQLVVARYVAEAIGRVSAKAEMEQNMEAMVEAKNHEIGRLRDKIQFYEVVNNEMSRRNQEVIGCQTSNMSNSSNGNSSGSNESDSEIQAGGNSSVGFGTEIGSGSGNPSSTRSSQNEGEGNADLNPSKSLAHYAKGTFDPKKPLLLYVSLVDAPSNNQRGKRSGGGSRHWGCNVCGHTWVGSYSRVRQHLLSIGGKGVSVCAKLTLLQRNELMRLQMAADAKGTFSSQNVASTEDRNASSKRKTNPSTRMPPPSIDTSSSKKKVSRSCAIGPTITKMYGKLKSEDTDDAIGKFLFANGIPFHVTRSPYYKEMVRSIASSGPSYVPPGEHKVRTVILERQVSNITMQKEQMKEVWVRSGCSIVMDGWTDITKRPLINIIVTCVDGPFFLRAIDCSGKRKDAAFQFELLRDAIEEVGPENVVQVVTDAAAVCRSAGLLVQSTYRHIFWTPCCVHALNNALKDIGKIDWVTTLVSAARDVQMFICNHHTSLAMYRAHSRKEFLKPTDTRYASYFLLLERMLEIQPALQAMVVTPDWNRWAESKTEEGKRIRLQILDNDWWVDCSYLVSFLRPIVEVIRYTDTDSPSLGEIYETFDSMLGKVREAIHQKEPSLEFYTNQIRPIIQRRWDRMNTPLHMAAYALNPKWYISRPGRIAPIQDPEIKKGFRTAIAKMYSEEEGQTLRRQWIQFAGLKGPFNKPDAKADRADLAQDDPIGWWDMHGDEAPEIQHLAIRLLSQIASSSAAERNWSTYSFIHSIKRNRLTSRRAEKLVAVHSALRLAHRKTPEYRMGPAVRWDVDPEDEAQIDEEDGADEMLHGLVGVPLVTPESDSDTDDDIPIDGPDAFMQQMDAEDQSMELTP